MNETYKSYWRTWGLLLALTVVMLFVDSMELPRGLFLGIVLAAMSAKAFFIAMEFMDLKHERMIVTFSIAFSILFFGAFLFALIVPDGLAVLAGGR